MANMGFFKKQGLDLSMPAVQSCLNLYALADQHDYLLCGHFDVASVLQHNLKDITKALELKGIRLRGMMAMVFGDDGKQSYLCCSSSSSHIGNEIVNFNPAHDMAEYSNQYYCAVIPKTFNFHYLKGCAITKGDNQRR